MIMSTFSKQFTEKVSHFNCKDLVHPEFESCLSFLWYLQRKTIVRCLKFFGPVFLIPLVLKYKKLTIEEWKEEWKDSTETYLKMVAGTSGIGWLSISSICVLFKIFKQIRLCNLAALPAILGTSTFIHVFPPKFIVRESKMLSTVMFMFMSSLIMGLKSFAVKGKSRFWYAQLYQSQTSGEIKIGDKEICLKNLLCEQLKIAIKIGLLMSSIKTLSNCLQLLKIGIFKFMDKFIRNFDYKLLGFLISYGISFQIVNYVLNKRYNKSKLYRNLFTAGFLAGITFYLSPRYFIFTYGFSTLIELLTQHSLELADQRSKMVNFLKHVPWLKIFFCLAIPSFSHWKITDPYMVPNFANTLLQTATNQRLETVALNYGKYVFGI